jgi:DNA-binding HxlR family transcriptional regulator
MMKACLNEKNKNHSITTIEDKNKSPIIIALNVIGGKWKVIILYMLRSEVLRFGELKKLIPKITQKMLSQQLKELEKDGLVTRTVYPEIPPKVEYATTELANELSPILDQLCNWGKRLS